MKILVRFVLFLVILCVGLPRANAVVELIPQDMVSIPAGSFQMGDTFSEGDLGERPVHQVVVSTFHMDKHEVAGKLWKEVYAWAEAHGYSFDHIGYSWGTDHPVQSVSWYDAVKWCNARSEKEGRIPAYYTGKKHTEVYRTGNVDVENGFVKWDAGYRLPTEAEWEKAARGGIDGHRFSWSDSDTITHDRANYVSKEKYAYDTSSTRGFHPLSNDGYNVTTCPTGTFPQDAYGLYDMAGNVWEWCFDWYADDYYDWSPETNPHGPITGATRAIRGGSNFNSAEFCRTANRDDIAPEEAYENTGFRTVLPSLEAPNLEVRPFSLVVAKRISDGRPVYELRGQAGLSYQIEVSTDLENWRTIATLWSSVDTIRFTDPNTNTARFYRAVLP